jgi:hypothetical protein
VYQAIGARPRPQLIWARLIQPSAATNLSGRNSTEVASARAKETLTLIFLAVALTSAVVGGAFTTRYTQFFPALKQVQLNIPSFTFIPTNTSLNARVNFAITNPSSYSGFTLTDFLTNFTIQGPGNVIIPQGLITSYQTRSSIDPGRPVTFAIPFSGFLSGPYRVYQIISSGATTSQFRFNFTATLFLSTFLDAYTSVIMVYQCTTTIQTGSCEEVALLLKNNPGASPYGGGT